jgi:uncharacterized protein YjlB
VEVSDISDQARKMNYRLTRGADAPKLVGRRTWVEYRDLGLTEASDGWVRAQFVGRRTEIAPPTGWHYHTADAQIIYFLQGWAELVFEDGKRYRAQAGDMLFIPGGTRHNDLISSIDLEVIEMSLPAKMGTVNCDTPEGLPEYEVSDELYQEALNRPSADALAPPKTDA